MKTKSLVLCILEKNTGTYVSGEQIASELSLSRTAVWKAVRTLQSEGYSISAISNKGYLLEDSDVLSAEGIRSRLLPKYADTVVIVKTSTESTNIDAKVMAAAGAKHGTVILAEEQIAGRGRYGKSFYSPKGTGIYLSIIARLGISFSDAVMITTAAGVAVCRSIESVSDLRPRIKWVNDIYLNGKKICGIGTEAVSNIESGTVESVIVGVGVNFKTSEFPEDLEQIAGPLFPKDFPLSRNAFAAVLINHLLDMFAALPEKSFIEEYRARSLILGKEIMFLEKNLWQSAKAVGIDDKGGLIVEKDGEIRTLTSGEVSVRI
jgi:BirA family biotin operon repressor/biotin-[acetyl-CoA-carboxylase] ligase